MRLKFTPGPWNIGIGNHEGEDWLCISPSVLKIGDTGPLICVISHKHAANSTDVNNARLIAAAPDMLEALISIYKEFKDDDMKQFSVKCWRIIIERATGMTINEILQEEPK